MKKRVYYVKTEGSDKLAQLLPKGYYSDFDKAVHTAKTEIGKFLLWKQQNSEEVLVHFQEREDLVRGYRVQMVFSFQDWYHIVSVRVDPTWFILRDD